jgi:tetratricopeptide (TPR) repeat protein
VVKGLGARILIIGAVVVAPVVERLAAQHGARTGGLPFVEPAASVRAADSSLSSRPGGARLALITIDYPAEGAIFPPEITAPTFLWRDAEEGAAAWLIEVAFADGAAGIQVKSQGERMRIGEIDPRCVGNTNKLPELTPQQAAARTWRPDAATWAAIKKHSTGHPATVTITGFRDKNLGEAVSRGQVTLQTSPDPVGAPIFYRDVPLMPSELQKGVIKPLAPNAMPLIAWRLRDIGQPSSRVLLEGMHTCANCHSFSRDGKTLGMDVDGPQNDKGLYALAAVKPHMSIRNEDVIKWSTFRGKLGGQLRVGFMSQVSPDGQYVLTMINDPGAQSREHLSDLQGKYYVANFKDYRFLQVFYPTRGILAWYSRERGHLQPLPGADDPRYVQTDGVWSPDGKYIVFARAGAKDSYPEGGKLAEYANDPNETQIQYNLYRIPFNAGKGGQPEPIAGASRNGMSNTFPKVSPDGRWIVFVKCRNGQLMRPDSQLYIVPFEGGQARRLQCNTPLMNSWHSFSPNGRWLVFSSKSRSPYTQLFLTHLDEEGNDSPAILLENSTAANRAVNIPEFVNIPPDGLAKIDVPAAEFYRLFDLAVELAQKKQYKAAIPEWKEALKLNPEDAKANFNFGVALAEDGRIDEAVTHYRKAVQADPEYSQAYTNLGATLAGTGKFREAVPQLEKALELNPEDPKALTTLGGALARSGKLDEAITYLKKAVELGPADAKSLTNLGGALVEKGRFAEAITYCRRALEVDPRSADAHNNLAAALLMTGRLDEAIPHFEKALAADPNSIGLQYNLGRVLAAKGRFEEAIPHLEKASAVRQAVIFDALAAAYAGAGRFPEAAQTARRGLDLATQQNNQALAAALKAKLALYEAKTPSQGTQ